MTDSVRDKWLKRLADEDKAHTVFRKRAADAEKEALNYDEEAQGPAFPIFKTTIELIHGRIYGQPPKPDVRKRHPGNTQSSGIAGSQQNGQVVGSGGIGTPTNPGNPVGVAPVSPSPMGAGQPQPQGPPQQGMMPQGPIPGPMPLQQAPSDDTTIAVCLERSLSYTIDTTMFDRDAHFGVNDFLTAGLGNAKVEMDVEVEEIPIIDQVTGTPMLDEDGQPLMVKQIVEQKLRLRHFSHSRFRWEPCKDWHECNWIAFDHELTQDAIEKQFKIKLPDAFGSDSFGGQEEKNVTGYKPPQRNKYRDTATVHEIWDKRKKQRLWITDAFPKVLEAQDDPLQLDNFYPCPCPMMSNVSGTELLPCPDFWTYKDLVDQANTLSRRIAGITKNVRDLAFYDQQLGELKAMVLDYPDGSLVPLKNLRERLGGTNGQVNMTNVIAQIDMTNKVGVLKELMQQLEWIKTRIYEINGIADIQRGISNPGDTATAQKIKNDWADIRTGQRVQIVALFFRDVFRIMAELISKHFTRDQIEAMSGIVLTDMQMATMRSDLAECYAVDVQSDSTMVENDAANQEQLTSFLQVFTPYLTQFTTAVKQGMLPADLAKEVMLAIVDQFKAGRQLSQSIEALPSTLQQLQGLTGQLQQAGQQNQMLQKQLQDAHSQLAQVNQHKEMREDYKVKSQADHNEALANLDAQRAGTESQQADVEALDTVTSALQKAHDSARPMVQ